MNRFAVFLIGLIVALVVGVTITAMTASATASVGVIGTMLKSFSSLTTITFGPALPLIVVVAAAIFTLALLATAVIYYNGKFRMNIASATRKLNLYDIVRSRHWSYMDAIGSLRNIAVYRPVARNGC